MGGDRGIDAMPSSAHTRAVASTDPLPAPNPDRRLPGHPSLDAVGPFEVFTGASGGPGRRHQSTPVYDVHLVSRAGGGDGAGRERAARSAPNHSPTPTSRSTPCSSPAASACREGRRHDAALVDWVRRAARGSRRIATVCTGTFLAAEAGLLADGTVTTHWAHAEQLAQSPS